MKDLLLFGKIASIIATLIGIGYSLFRINKGSIARSKLTAIEHTRMNLKIIEIEKDILEMKAQKEKDNTAFAELVEKIDARYEKLFAKQEMKNDTDHVELFKLNREQTGIISTVAAGVARIEGKLEGLGK